MVLIGFFQGLMANHEIWYFCHDQPLKYCQLCPGDRGVTQILPNSVTVSLPKSGTHDSAWDCKSGEILLAFWGAPASGKMWHHFILIKGKWILLLHVKKTWKSHPWKLWNWDTNINNIKCVRSPHITLGFEVWCLFSISNIMTSYPPCKTAIKSYLQYLPTSLFTYSTQGLWEYLQMFPQCFEYVKYDIFKILFLFVCDYTNKLYPGSQSKQGNWKPKPGIEGSPTDNRNGNPNSTLHHASNGQVSSSERVDMTISTFCLII